MTFIKPEHKPDWSASVYCESCKWAGLLGDCRHEINNLIDCPRCGTPVMYIEDVPPDPPIES